MNKNRVVLLTLIVSLAFNLSAFGAEKKAAPTGKNAPAQEALKPQNTAPAMQPLKTNIAYGEVVSIDLNSSVLTIKDATGATESSISFTPSTGVTKMTDASEIKQGDKIRIIYQDNEGKKVAKAIMFGKIRTAPAAPKPMETPKK